MDVGVSCGCGRRSGVGSEWPGTEPAKPVLLPVPDPLVMTDGTKVTTVTQWWEHRRPELLRLLEENIYGKMLLGRPENLRFIVREMSLCTIRQLISTPF